MYLRRHFLILGWWLILHLIKYFKYCTIIGDITSHRATVYLKYCIHCNYSASSKLFDLDAHREKMSRFIRLFRLNTEKLIVAANLQSEHSLNVATATATTTTANVIAATTNNTQDIRRRVDIWIVSLSWINNNNNVGSNYKILEPCFLQASMVKHMFSCIR